MSKKIQQSEKRNPLNSFSSGEIPFSLDFDVIIARTVMPVIRACSQKLVHWFAGGLRDKSHS